MRKERWVPVSGREAHYEVSDLGRVRSLPGGHGRGAKGGLLKAGMNSSGYYGVVLSKGALQKEWRSVHRLVATAFVKNENGHPFVNHIDHDKANNTHHNLEWCTAKQNTQHSARHGRMKSGRNHSKAVGVEVRKGDTLIGRFDTLTDAALALGVPYPSIVACRGDYRGYTITRLPWNDSK